MAKLVYIVDWLPPDYGAIGQYALAESRERAAGGDDVVLVGLSSTASTTETEAIGKGSLRVVRFHSVPVDRASFRRRAVWTLRTDALLVARALKHLLTADEILFTASPPFLEHLLVPLSAVLPGRLIFRVADLHPEALMNELDSVPRWLSAFQALARFHRRHAAAVEVLGEDQRRMLVAQGVAPERITVRRSVCPVAIDAATRPSAIPAELAGRATLLYSGAVGYAHEFETFVEGYRLHHASGTGRVGFWLNASGGHADAFEQAVRAHGLPIHRSRPVPLDELASLLVTPAAHLITLRDEYVGLVVPSKVYGCLASKRDILFIGSAESDVDLLCRPFRGNGYERVSVGDPAGVAAALERLADRAPVNAADAGGIEQ